jgi:hypothetical protein
MLLFSSFMPHPFHITLTMDINVPLGMMHALHKAEVVGGEQHLLLILEHIMGGTDLAWDHGCCS